MLQFYRSRVPIVLIVLCVIAFVTTVYLVFPYWKEFREIRDFVSTVEANRYDLLAIERACEAMQKEGKRNVTLRGLECVLRDAEGDIRAAGLAMAASLGLDAEPLLPLIRRISACETPESELARSVLCHFKRVSGKYADCTCTSSTESEGRHCKGLRDERFPLSSRGGFEEDLDYLAQVVAAKLEFPTQDYTRDRLLGSELDHMLELAGIWPESRFREPLLGYLMGDKANRVQAAEALLVSGSRDLRYLVERFRGFVWERPQMCIVTTYSIDDHLRSPSPPSAFEASATYLPLDDEGHLAEWPDGITLPDAVTHLKSKDASIRLQSWVWLAMHGVIAPTDAVRDAWPHLSDQERVELIRHVSKHYFGIRWFRDETRKYVGTECLRTLFEDLLTRCNTEQLGELVEVRLLIGLAEFESPVARQRARQIISERIDLLGADPSDEFALSDRALEGAIYALALSPTADDLALFSEIFHGPNDTLRKYAAFAIAGIPVPGAVGETRRIILEDPGSVWGYAIDAVQYQSLRDMSMRREYLEIVVEAMHTRSVGYYASLIDTFECLVGHEMGWNGRMGGGGYNKQAASETVQKCLEWYEANSLRL